MHPLNSQGDLFGLFVLRRLLHIVQEIAEISSMVTWPSYFAYASQQKACRFSCLSPSCHDLIWQQGVVSEYLSLDKLLFCAV